MSRETSKLWLDNGLPTTKTHILHFRTRPRLARNRAIFSKPLNQNRRNGISDVAMKGVRQIRQLSLTLMIAAVFGSCGPSQSQPEIASTPTFSPSSRSGAALARITCTRESTKVHTPVVEAHRDGVHVEVTNRAGEPVSIYGIGLDSSEGIERHVIQQPPGAVKVGCAPYSLHAAGFDPDRVALDISDPRANWVNPNLSCPREHDLIQSTVHDYSADARGERGNPVRLAHERVRNLHREDNVERAAYPRSRDATVRVVRAQHVIAALHFDRRAKGRWLLGSDELCSSTGLRIR